ALRRQAAEIAHARQRDVDQPVKKLVHARLAQRHLAADRLAGAQLEGRDQLARLGDHRLLAGDQAEVGAPPPDLLPFADAFADAHVADDLFEPRHLHAVLVTAFLDELLAHHLIEMGAQPGGHALFRAPRLLFASLRLLPFVALARLALPRLALVGLLRLL